MNRANESAWHDKICAGFSITHLAWEAGCKFEGGIGNGYGPPVPDPLQAPLITAAWISVQDRWVSFHPILKCPEPAALDGAPATGDVPPVSPKS